ncbi:MAG: helix-hairpin-helix domain-containing protein [Bacteroidota bacterium]
MPFKDTFRSYTTFTSAERRGIVGFGILLVILIIIRGTMHLWVHPEMDDAQQQRLSAQWAAMKVATAEKPTSQVLPEHQDGNAGEPVLPDKVNINTADSQTLVQLKGIGPAVAGKIIIRRKTKGYFTDISQLSEVGGFSPVTMDILRRHIVFAGADTGQ